MSTRVDFEAASNALGLEQRLREVPQSAETRGVFFNLVENELARRGLVDAAVARTILGPKRKSYGFYPTRDLLGALAKGAALVSPDDPREGIRQLFSGGPAYFASTWYGQAFSRFLHPNPGDAMSWIERSREHVANYGFWRVEHRGKGHMVVHMFDEYLWIETAQRGGCEGLLLACGVSGEVTAELDRSFSGRLIVRWDAR